MFLSLFLKNYNCKTYFPVIFLSGYIHIIVIPVILYTYLFFSGYIPVINFKNSNYNSKNYFPVIFLVIFPVIFFSYFLLSEFWFLQILIINVKNQNNRKQFSLLN